MSTVDSARKRRRRVPPQVRWVLTAVVLAVVLYVVLPPEIAGARKSLHLLAEVNVAFIVLAFGLEVASLVAYAMLTEALLPKRAVSLGRLLRINMSSLCVSHVVPGGTAPGTGVAYDLLTDSGVSGGDTAFALALQGAGSAVVLNAILWVSLVVSLGLPFKHGYNPLYGVAAGVGSLLLGAFGAVVLLLLRGRNWAVETLRRLANHVPLVNGDALADGVGRMADRLREMLELEQRRLLYRAVGWAAANWLLDAASLWVFIVAFPGHHLVFPIYLLVAYGLANVLAVIPITPGGLGIVEGVLIPTLHGFGLPASVALVAVLSYRLVNFWLPIPVGAGTYVSLKI